MDPSSLRNQIYTNKNLKLSKIEWIGFDLDFTLAMYKYPVYEQLIYQLIIEGLLRFGYEEGISKLVYDPTFIVRGLLVDRKLGNVLQLERTYNIIAAHHGKTPISKQEIKKLYPSSRIPPDQISTQRFELINTNFSTPEIAIFCDLVDYFDKTGQSIEYLNLWQDIRHLSDKHHLKELKEDVIKDLDKYVHTDPKLGECLWKLKQAGKKLFLLTNSPWYYANALMEWILPANKDHGTSSWFDYIDVTIVQANKPDFFIKTQEFREIDPRTGNPNLFPVHEFKKGVAYSTGCLSVFDKLCGITAGKHVLYVGDHIFSDVTISKKKHAWRTLLILPELEDEVKELKAHLSSYSQLIQLKVSEKKQDQSDKEQQQEIRRNLGTNQNFGSAFRNGYHQTLFSMQVGRYADIYSSSVLNLGNYPVDHTFLAPVMLLPHERQFGMEPTLK